MTTRRLLSALFSLVLCFLPVITQAQSDFSHNLAAALDQADWDANRQGPLLVVDPWRVARVEKDAPAQSGKSLADAAGEFGRDIAQEGEVTTLAPPAMTVLNTAPGRPNVWEGLDRRDRMRLLEASLTASQWGRMVSSQGLGLADMMPEQQGLFQSLLPDPFRVKQAAAEKGGASSVLQEPIAVLDSDERSQVRLRLSLGLDVGLVLREGVSGGGVQGGPSVRPDGTSFFFVDSELGAAPENAGPFGVALRADVPNQLKPSQLSFALPALAAPVSLAHTDSPPQTPARPLTVGELIRRVGSAAHLEMYADQRIATLPVWTRGQIAPARDVLRALCLSLTSTFRQVGPAFVLTDDLLGIGARRALLADWYSDAEAEQRAQRDSVRTALVSQPLLQILQFSANDPLAPSPSLADHILSAYSKTGLGYEIAVSDLTGAQQKYARSYIQCAVDQKQPFRTDLVRLGINLRLSYLVPGLGEVTDLAPTVGPLSDMTPQQPPTPIRETAPDAPLTFPAGWVNRALYIAPQNPAEAALLVAEARQHGMTQIWIDAPRSSDRAPLKAAIKAGQANGIAVFAVVRLLRLGADASDADVNILGETTAAYGARRLKTAAFTPNTAQARGANGKAAQNWTRVDVPQTVRTLQSELTSLAATSGLAGIVLRDTAAPGYERPQTPASPFANFSPEAAGDLGYTPETRLAFLRQAGVDPIDLAPSANSVGLNLNLPFYPDFGVNSAPSQEWTAYRYRESASLIHALYAVVRAAVPIIAERTANAWYGSWDGPNALPMVQTQTLGRSLAPQARSQSRRIFLNLTGAGEQTLPTEYKAMLRRILKGRESEVGWDGVVLDMSQVSASQASSLLTVFNSVGLSEAPRTRVPRLCSFK